MLILCHRGKLVITAVQIHQIELDVMSCGNSNTAAGLSEVCDDVDL